MFPGGCFFAAVGAEFEQPPRPREGARRRLHARLAGELEAAATEAQAAGELPASPEPQQLAYEVDALLLMAHAAYTTLGDPAVLERSRRGIERLLGPQPA